MHKENSFRQLQIYSQLNHEESTDIDKMISGLDKFSRSIYTESAEIEKIIDDIKVRRKTK